MHGRRLPHAAATAVRTRWAADMNRVSHQSRVWLRTLLVLIPVIALFTAFPVAFHFVAWTAPFTGITLGVVAFVLVWRAARPGRGESGEPSVPEHFIACLAFLPVVGAWFVRHRWLAAFEDDRWPRPFPYPDLLLLEIHDWWDRLHPAGPGAWKYHGEFYAVLLGTNVLFLFACATAGVFCGYGFRNCDIIGAVRRLTPSGRGVA
jgi:hypothetical protein